MDAITGFKYALVLRARQALPTPLGRPAGRYGGLRRHPWVQSQGFPLFFLILSYIYAPAIGPSEVRFPATATNSRLQGSLGVGSERLAGWGVIRSRLGGH